MFRSVIAVFTAFCLVACTSMRPIDATRPESVRATVRVGDEVSVNASNGKTYLLVLTAVDDEKIVGTGDNKKVTIRYEQIKSIEVRKVSAGKTAGLTLGVIGAILLTAIIVFIATFKGIEQ